MATIAGRLNQSWFGKIPVGLRWLLAIGIVIAVIAVAMVVIGFPVASGSDATAPIVAAPAAQAVPPASEKLPAPQLSQESSAFPRTEEIIKMMGVWGNETNPTWGWGEYTVLEDGRIDIGGYTSKTGDTIASERALRWISGAMASAATGQIQSPIYGSDAESKQVGNWLGERLVDRKNLDAKSRLPTYRRLHTIRVEPGKFYGVETFHRPEGAGGDVKILAFSAILTITFQGERGKETVRVRVKDGYPWARERQIRKID